MGTCMVRHSRWPRMLALLAAIGLSMMALLGCTRVGATIQSHEPMGSPKEVEEGEGVPLSVTVENTGNRMQTLTARAIVWDGEAREVARFERSSEEEVRPGGTFTASWTYTAEEEGNYWLQFLVVRDSDITMAYAPERAANLITVTLPAIASEKFELGDRVRVTTNLKVRVAAGTDQPEVESPNYPGSVPLGSLGTVVDGPERGGAYVWWKIEYDRGVTGWSAEDWLEHMRPRG